MKQAPMRPKLTIKLRLVATLLLLGTLLVVIGSLGLIGMRNSNEAVKEAYLNDVAAATALGSSTLNLTIVRTTLDRVLLHPEAPETPALIEKALGYLAVSNRSWSTYDALKRSDDEAALSKNVADARAHLLDGAIEPMIDAMKKGDHDRADKIAMTVVPTLAATLTQASAALDKFRNDQGGTRYLLAQHHYDTFSTIAMIAVIVGLLACVAKAIKALIDASASRVADGSRLVNQAGVTMTEVRESVRRVSAIMGEIATASAEQSEGIEQVNRAVSQMDEVSQQNAALVEQAAAAAASLDQQTVILQSATARFRLKAMG
jgi:methyl-accepting chemotaxis protein I, serine sensor receptor